MPVTQGIFIPIGILITILYCKFALECTKKNLESQSTSTSMLWSSRRMVAISEVM